MSSETRYHCNKCGYSGPFQDHMYLKGCRYLAVDMIAYLDDLAKQPRKLSSIEIAIRNVLVKSPLSHHDYPHRTSYLDDLYPVKSCKPNALKVSITVICQNWKYLSQLLVLSH